MYYSLTTEFQKRFSSRIYAFLWIYNSPSVSVAKECIDFIERKTTV